MDNKWVNAFYADYTFEVDFFLSGNEETIIQSLKNIYIQQAAINTSMEKLKVLDTETGGREALRLADEVAGKGWFSLLLVEQLSYQSYIPTYIIEAICFVSQLNENHLRKIIKHRAEEGLFIDEKLSELYTFLSDEPEEDYSFTEIVNYFYDLNKNDQFFQLYNVYTQYMEN
ncbi:hypothetical protein M1K46_19910 [Fictibacillus sp. WQ 8-8]|uniref:hypothetical protein n=1 Tax=Fictibacillus sp. WQ 8-8 TaxID=2938788 RepID=UPI00210914E6|nr:hypothetical protein [Fictibacillus sp. WQ 8-8]MCQ6267893.1 hypothetical protein [Fictibacillus sp. WQ 8-8]